MKLYIVQEGDSVGGRAVKIYDDRGHPLPGVTAVTVRHSIDDAARLTIELVVNDRDIVFGAPPTVPAKDLPPPPPDRDRRRS